MAVSLPFTAPGLYHAYTEALMINAGVTGVHPGPASIIDDVNTLSFSLDFSGAPFTNSGKKGSRGFIIYEASS